jgi:hypothetical protein
MANIAPYLQKAMLDWSLNTQTATRPAAWFCGLSNGAISSTSFSEIATATVGATRQSASFAPAATVASSGTISNSVAMTFSFTQAATVSGLFISDSVSSGAGTGLWYGTLAAVRSPLATDSLVFAVGALTITLN